MMVTITIMGRVALVLALLFWHSVGGVGVGGLGGGGGVQVPRRFRRSLLLPPPSSISGVVLSLPVIIAVCPLLCLDRLAREALRV